VVGNNSTNINKTNNYLSPKESLNSNGQQFHQYQQNSGAKAANAPFIQSFS
jgi:hypothetical protein